MKQPNIDYMTNMTKEYLEGEIECYAYNLDFSYELEKRYKNMQRENENYCNLIYECLYEEGVARYDDLSEMEFKKMIRKQYNYIRRIAREDFY